MWAEAANFVQSVGFPVFVALYVLMRLEPSIKGLDESIRLLTIIVAKIQGLSVDDVRREYEAGDVRRR